MGNFTELVLSFEFRPDVPPEVLASVSSLALEPDHALAGPPAQQIVRYNPYDEPAQEPFWQYDWGPFFGVDMSRISGGICGAVLAKKAPQVRPESWTLTARAVHKAYPEEIAPAVLWLGPYACPHAEAGYRELVGYMKTGASDRPILIWHDGHEFVLEDLNPHPGEYR